MTSRRIGLAAVLGAAFLALNGCGGGDTGPAGKDGVDGVNGKDGLPGTNGTDGKDGLPGDAGPPGPAGETGPAGEAGRPGADLTTGTVDATQFTVDDLRNIHLGGKILSVDTSGNQPVVQFQVTNADSGEGIRGLRTFSLHIAQLVPPPAATPNVSSYWQNYIALGLPLTATPTLVNPVTVPGTDGVTTYNPDGTVLATGYTVVDNNDGTYKVTFGTNIKANTNVPYDATLTHRVVVGVRSVVVPGIVGKTAGAYAGPMNPQTGAVVGSFTNTNGTNLSMDFVPSTSTVLTTPARDIVAIAACNSCHYKLQYGSNNTSGHFGSRTDTKTCVMCHTPQNQLCSVSASLSSANCTALGGTYAAAVPATATAAAVAATCSKVVTSAADCALVKDAEGVAGVWSTGGTFTNFIHQIHRGEGLPVNTVTPLGVNVADIAFPQDIRNCTKCHQGAVGTAFYNSVNAMACNSCHNDKAASAPGRHNHIKASTGEKTDDKCVNCHDGTSAISPAIAHNPVADPDPAGRYAVYAAAKATGLSASATGGGYCPLDPTLTTSALCTAKASAAQCSDGVSATKTACNNANMFWTAGTWLDGGLGTCSVAGKYNSAECAGICTLPGGSSAASSQACVASGVCMNADSSNAGYVTKATCTAASKTWVAGVWTPSTAAGTWTGSNNNTNASYTAAAGVVPKGATIINYVVSAVGTHPGVCSVAGNYTSAACTTAAGTWTAKTVPYISFKFTQAVKDATTGVVGATSDVAFPAFGPGITEMMTGFVGSPSAYFAWSIPQDGIASPVDYNQSASVYLKGAWNGSVAASTARLDAPATGSTYYTLVLTGTTLPTTAKMLVGGIGYTYGLSTTQPLTQTNLPDYPFVATPNAAIPGQEGGTGGLSVPPPNVWLTGTGFTARRLIADSAKCNACHGALGVSPTFHAGQRNNVETCTFCHTANRTNSGWAVNAKDAFHGIHAGAKRTQKFSWEATAGAQFWNIGYPGILKNCEQCHRAGTYDFSASQYTEATVMSMLPSYQATGTTRTDAFAIKTGTEVVTDQSQVISPWIAAGADYGKGFATSNITSGWYNGTQCTSAAPCSCSPGAPCNAEDKTVASSPIAAACFACHDTLTAKAHMEQNGGSVYRPRSVVMANTEGCLVCHGPASSSTALFNEVVPTVKAVHRWW